MTTEHAHGADGIDVDREASAEPDHLVVVVDDELEAAEQRVKDATAARDELKKQKRERS